MIERSAGGAVLVVLLVAAPAGVAASASVAVDSPGNAIDGVPAADRPVPIGGVGHHPRSSGQCPPRCEWETDVFFETPSNGTTVVIERATFDAPGFVVLTNESGGVIGVSGLQDVGDSRHLPIDLYRPLRHSQDITGTVWYDDGDGEFARDQDNRSNVSSTVYLKVVDLNHNGEVSTTGYPPTPEYEDVTGDGAVTTADVEALFSHLSTASHYPDRFDFDGDASMTTADVLALFNLL